MHPASQTHAEASGTVSYSQICRIAWPIILANAAVPLLGLVDTAVIGHHGQVEDLGAIALGALTFNFVFWTFGFLRMGTTGFIAQAGGAGDEPEVRAVLGRSLVLAVALGALLFALQIPIAIVALKLLGASEATEAITRSYIAARIWGAPATLALFALLGAMIGLGHTRMLLAVQVFMNGLNIVLDILFAGVLGLGAPGVAVGSAISEWAAAILALTLVYRLLRRRHRDGEPFWPWDRMRDARILLRTLRAHLDIMIRTFLLLVGFGYFTQQGARFGDSVLAANHVLLQFIALAAFFLDGFAFSVEALVGTAAGAGHRQRFDQAVRRSSILAGATSLVLAAALAATGPFAMALLTDLPDVRELARRYLGYGVLYIPLAVAAFQLDGIFIGATRTRDMRNASIASLAVLLAAGWLLTPRLGNDGLWIAFNVYVAARGVTLALYYPRLRRSIIRHAPQAPSDAP